VTTLPKAQGAPPFVEKLVTLGKRGDLHARPPGDQLGPRRSSRVGKLFAVLGPRYAERNGGYIRVLKAGFRHGDNAAMAVIEFVDRDPSERARIAGPVAETFGRLSRTDRLKIRKPPGVTLRAFCLCPRFCLRP